MENSELTTMLQKLNDALLSLESAYLKIAYICLTPDPIPVQDEPDFIYFENKEV